MATTAPTPTLDPTATTSTATAAPTPTLGSNSTTTATPTTATPTTVTPTTTAPAPTTTTSADTSTVNTTTVAPTTTTPAATTPATTAPAPTTVKPTTTPAPKPTATPKPAPAAPVTPAAPQTEVDPYAALGTAYKAALNATDDPVSHRAFNVALNTLALTNQAAMEQLEMKVKSDPALSGQGTGTAFLTDFAQKQGTSVDDLIGKLSVESAANIRALNQWGAAGLQAVTQLKTQQQQQVRSELLNAGDYDGYASAMEQQTGIKPNVDDLKASSPASTAAASQLADSIKTATASGDTARAEQLFKQLQALQPKTYGSLTLNDLISKAEAFDAHNTQNQAISADIRQLWSQGDTAGAVSGLHNLYDEATGTAGGKDIISSKSITDINAMLTAAGMAPATDEASLIGREDDVFIASKLNDINTEGSKTSIDKEMTSLAQDLGVKAFDPDAQKYLRIWLTSPGVMNADGTLAAGAGSAPWSEDNPHSYLFTTWPSLDGKGGGEMYGPDNPEPNPATEPATYAYKTALDTAWQNYTSATPAADQLTRSEWFKSVSGNTANLKNGVLSPDGKGNLALGAVADKAAMATQATLNADVPATADGKQTFVEAFKTLSQADQDAYLSTPTNVTKAVTAGAIFDASKPTSLSATTTKNIISDYGGMIKAADGKAYTISNPNEFHGSGIGEGFQVTGTDGKTYVVLNGTGITDIFKAGVAYPSKTGSAKSAVNFNSSMTDTTNTLIENPPGSGKWYVIQDTR